MALEKEWLLYLQLKEERPEEFRKDERLEIIFDEKLVEDFQRKTGKVFGVVYQSPYRILVVDLVKRGDEIFAYERFLLAKKGGVSVITLYKGKFVLLKQFRHTLRGEQIAFVRGFGETGLSNIENAKKELEEELGATTTSAIELTSVIADCGASSSPVAIVLCEVDNIELKYHYEGIEEVLLLTEEELEEKILNGEINDGYTIASLAIYKSWRKKQQKELIL